MRRPRNAVVADAFWAAAGGRHLYGCPILIERAAARALPVAVCRVSDLNSGHVTDFLNRIEARPWLDGNQRPLRGCLVADAGAALIFVDGSDPEDEQRLTIAHEVAHLLLHYLKPRQNAVDAFGDQILAVLDRARPPSIGERFSSALRNVPIEPFRHAMDRPPGALCKRVNKMEDDADDLAIELIAPSLEVRALAPAAPDAIMKRFGLPRPAATRLASTLGQPRTSQGVISLFTKNRCRTSQGSFEE